MGHITESTHSQFTVAILGATGQTGKWALKGAVLRGWNVRVLARSADKVKTIFEQSNLHRSTNKATNPKFNDQVSVVECNAFEVEKLEGLIRGVDVVMSFVGMVKRGEAVVEPAVQNVLAAIKNLPVEQRPKNFLSMSTLGVNDGVALARQAWGYITTCCTGFIPGLKDSFRDLAAGEQLIMESRTHDQEMTKLTIVRCSILADGKKYDLDLGNDSKPAYTIVKMDEDARGKTSFDIDRQQVAQGFLDMCCSGEFDGMTVALFRRKK